MTSRPVTPPKKKSSSTLTSRFQPAPQVPVQVQVEEPLTAQPASLESDLAKYRVVQRLIPDISLARHIVDSDDHAFASLDECCHDINNNTQVNKDNFEAVIIIVYRKFELFFVK